MDQLVHRRRELAAELERVPVAQEAYRALQVGPAEGSEATLDARTGFGQYVVIHSLAGLGDAIGHLLAWHRLRLSPRGYVPVGAHMTLLRAAVEGTSLARWLVDPNASERIRIERGLAARLYDLNALRKLERCEVSGVGPPKPPEFVPADRRMRDLRRRAEAAGYRPPSSLNYTALVTEFGPGECLYRLLCSFAHPAVLIPSAASLRSVVEKEDLIGLQVTRVEADEAIALLVTKAAVHATFRALNEVAGYLGRVAAVEAALEPEASP